MNEDKAVSYMGQLVSDAAIMKGLGDQALGAIKGLRMLAAAPTFNDQPAEVRALLDLIKEKAGADLPEPAPTGGEKS